MERTMVKQSKLRKMAKKAEKKAAKKSGEEREEDRHKSQQVKYPINMKMSRDGDQRRACSPRMRQGGSPPMWRNCRT
jgi:hypothetical protein